MKVIIEDSCVGCGACQSVCDAVFSMEDKAIVDESAIAANEAGVKDAAESCPVSAIIIE